MERAVFVYTTYPSLVEAEQAGRAWSSGGCGLRQHPAGHDLALLVAGRDRARRGGGDDHQDPRLARRARARPR